MQPKKVIRTILSPFQQFVKLEAASGLLLLIAAVVALAWANSPWAETYFHFWETKISFQIGQTEIANTLHHWINDGLMVVFFFTVGLEIKREVMEGELSTLQKAILPFLAAIGGMVIPVMVFFILYDGTQGQEGWGIPMATDIAFSIGILSLLGNRVSLGMNVFLTAFAIVDDIGAVLVIAIYYSQDIAWTPLLISGGVLLIILLFNYLGIKNIWPYVLLTLVIWYYFLQSGVHPTIAGILSAFCIPSINKINLQTFIENVRKRIRRIRNKYDTEPDRYFLPQEELKAIQNIKEDARRVQPPLQRLEEDLHSFVAYFVMPVFAFANAGVALSNGEGPVLTNLTLSIATALVLGKAIGIFSFSWAGVKLGLANLPRNTIWSHILGLAFLGGVGFTMSLFIANLAFDPGGLVDNAKIGVLIGSAISGVIGYFILRRTTSVSEEEMEEYAEEGDPSGGVTEQTR